MEARNRNSVSLKVDILKSFGADLDLEIKDPICFISENVNAIAYPVGHHIAIRDLFVRQDLRKNDIMFINNETDVIKITALNCSRDHNLLLVCEKKEKHSCISIYNLMKLNFNTICLFKPKRKVISTIYRDYIYAAFSLDGNNLVTIGYSHKDNISTLVGLVWDIQIFQPFKEDNYKPRCVFDVSPTINKITIETKLICATGVGALTFYYIYENNVKEFRHPVKNLSIPNNNFMDHDWIAGKIPNLVTITEKNEIFILEGYFDKKVLKKRNDEEHEDISLKIEKFVIKQHIVNCFGSFSVTPSIIRSYSKGLIAGSTNGYILFLEKTQNLETPYQIVRHITRDKPAKVCGLSFNNNEEYLCIAYNSNEICYLAINQININLKNRLFEIRFELVCQGFHQGAITSMDVALQRPIIITSSQTDKTIRVWNYLTGHCEYCKIILTEKDDVEKEMDILSVAIHPNGYYIAVSDKEMIRFFHLCYKELRFYNNDVVGNDNPKSNCYLLKFSHGGHLLAAVSGKTLYIIRAFTRETLKIFKTNHAGQIKSIVFHESDFFVYSVGNDGMIIEYNLTEYTMNELSSKYINYSDSEICSSDKKDSILACGYQSNGKYSISQIDIGSDNNDNPGYTLTQPALSICQIRSKRYDVVSLAVGTEDGYINILPFPFDNFIWDSIKSHRSEITHLYFSRETNLLFSAGKDGNLFIYCIHEIQESPLGAEAKASFNQLSSVLDEGLGENVLYSLENIFQTQNLIDEMQIKIADNYKNEQSVVKDYENKFKDREKEYLKNKEFEMRTLNDIIKEIKISKESTIEHYENHIKQIIQENNKTLIDKEKAHNERIDQLNSQIQELNSRINYLKSNHELSLKIKEDEYDRKFRDLEKDLKKKFDEAKGANDKLNEEIIYGKKLEEMKLEHLDLEHEQEIMNRENKYENIISVLRDEKNRMNIENKQLTEILRHKESLIHDKDNRIKKMNEQIEQLSISLQNTKKLNELKDKEFKDLKNKLNESEKLLQEKSKLAGFSMKLKNELYKKNAEIVGNYNIQQENMGDLKMNTKNIERELEEAMRMLEENEKEMKKNKLLISELKKKLEEEHKFAKSKGNELDELLQKFYEVFQSNDKNTILKGLRQIYSIYLTPEVISKINSTKLNINIKDELEKQIDFLQKSLINCTELKSKKENIQKNEIFKKTEQNSVLINELNEKIRNYTVLERDYFKLKSENCALMKQLENMKRHENDKKLSLSQSRKNLVFPEITRTQELLNNNTEDLFFPKNQTLNISHNYDMPKTFHYGNGIGNGSPTNAIAPFNPFMKGKIIKGSVVAKSKVFSDTNKINELIKIIEDKDDIIQRLRNDVKKLRNDTLTIKDNSILNDANFLNYPAKLPNPNNSNMNMINNSGEELI